MSFGRHLAATAAIAGLVAFAQSATAQIELKISAYQPPKHPVVAGGLVPFAAAVEKDSGGTIRTRLFTGGSLLGARAQLAGIRDGIAEAGPIVFGYFPAELPHAQLILNLGLVGTDSVVKTGAITELNMLACAPCRDEMLRQGIVYLGGPVATPYVLISRSAIDDLDDLRGKKMRAAGAHWDRWVRHIGGTPVNVPATEAYEGMSRGIIDIAILAPAHLNGFSLWEVSKQITMLNLGAYQSSASVVVNQRFWRGLSSEHRRILLANAAMATLGATFAFIDDDVDALKKAEARSNFIVAQPTEAMLADLKAFTERDVQEVARIARDQFGIADPETVINTYRSLYAKYEKLFDPVAGDRAAMIAIMQREIYDKIDPDSYGM